MMTYGRSFLYELIKYLIILAFVWLTYKSILVVKAWLKKRKSINLLPGPPTLPLIGNLHLFITRENFFKIFTNILETYYDVSAPIRLWIGHKPVLLISRAEDAHIILNSPKCMEKEERYKFMKEFLGDGLLTAEVPIWKRHRKLMNPMFAKKILDSYVPIFDQHSKVLIQKLEKQVGNGVFDCTYYIAPCVLDFILGGLMGISSNVQNADDTVEFMDNVLKVMDITQKRINNPWLMPDILFKMTNYATDQQTFYKSARKWIDEVIIKKVDMLKTKDVDMNDDDAPKSMLGPLIELTQSNSDDKWTMEELKAEVDTIFLTGVDTSATTVCFLLMMLGMHPEIQQKLYDEIFDIFGDSARPPTPEDLKRMNYMEKAIKETLRFFPIAPYIGRMTTDDVELENCTIPKDTGCMITIRSIQLNPKYWGDDWNVFNPDRFSPERSGKYPPAFLAFSIGPRNCIGAQYSYVAMKVLLSSILRAYTVKCDLTMSDMNLQISLVIKSTDGFKISLEKRNISRR